MWYISLFELNCGVKNLMSFKSKSKACIEGYFTQLQYFTDPVPTILYNIVSEELLLVIHITILFNNNAGKWVIDIL